MYNDECLVLHDVEKPTKHLPTLEVARYQDMQDREMIKISSLPNFARKAIKEGLKNIAPPVDSLLQIYCTPNSFKTIDGSKPFQVKGLINEYAFTLRLQQGILSVRRRYLSPGLPPKPAFLQAKRDDHE